MDKAAVSTNSVIAFGILLQKAIGVGTAIKQISADCNEDEAINFLLILAFLKSSSKPFSEKGSLPVFNRSIICLSISNPLTKYPLSERTNAVGNPM